MVDPAQERRVGPPSRQSEAPPSRCRLSTHAAETFQSSASGSGAQTSKLDVSSLQQLAAFLQRSSSPRLRSSDGEVRTRWMRDLTLAQGPLSAQAPR